MASTKYTDFVTLMVASWLNDVDTAVYDFLFGIGGTPNAITASGALSMTAYAAGQNLYLIPAASNTGAVTINVNSLGVKAVTKNGTTPLVAGDLLIGAVVELYYDGTQFQLMDPQKVAVAAGGTGATTVQGAYTNLTGGNTFSLRNKLINGDFRINQRVAVSGTALALSQYFLDRWRSSAAANSPTWAASGVGRVVTVGALGIEQVIEGNNIEGGVYTLSWQGTATATVNGSAVTNGGQTAALPANTNVTVKWVSGTLNNTQLELGTIVTPFEQRPWQVEMLLCQRYYEKSYEYATAVGTAAAPSGQAMWWGFDANNLLVINPPFRVEKRISAPAFQVYQPVAGTAGSVRNATSGASIALTAFSGVSSWGPTQPQSGAGFVAGTWYQAQWDCSAEI